MTKGRRESDLSKEGGKVWEIGREVGEVEKR